ncbi:MAG: tetratricopeptide repeat protein [Fibrobacterota bacterium]
MLSRRLGIAIVFFMGVFFFPCADTAADSAETLMALEKYREAAEIIKAEYPRPEADRRASLLLARSYILQGNSLWAMKTISGYTAANPSDYEALSWLAWIHLSGGRLNEALDVISRMNKADGDCNINRQRMLLAAAKIFLGKKREAASEFADLKNGGAIYSEDTLLYNFVRSGSVPFLQSPLRFRAELTQGRSSNPSSSSANEPENVSEGSAFTEFTGKTVFSHFFSPQAAPFAEVEAGGLYYPENYASDFSYISFSLKAGNYSSLNSGLFKAYLDAGSFLLKGGTPGLTPWDTAGVINSPEEWSRAEWLYEYLLFKTEFSRGRFTWFMNAGGRNYRHFSRSRKELSAGLYGHFSLKDRHTLGAALSGRLHFAENEKYDIVGSTLLLSWNSALHAGLDFFMDNVLFYDKYDHFPGTRKDLLYNIRTGLIKTAGPAEFDLYLKYAERLSDIGEYTFSDLRIGLSAVIDIGIMRYPDFCRTGKNHVPLTYEGLGGDEENGRRRGRIMRLLRQRDDIQRSSSCMN